MKFTVNKQNVARIYFIFVLAVSPLYISNGYHNILDAKNYIVWLSIVIGAGLSIYLFLKWLANGVTKKTIKAEFISGLKKFISSVDLMDIFVAIFALTSLISSCISGYVHEAFSGSMAWGVGGAMIIALSLMYFITSREMKPESGCIYAMMISGIIAMVLAVLNDLWIDPLKIMTEDDNWKDHFTSTIGNIDQFGAYLSIVIIIMVMMFVMSENGFKRAGACVVLFFGYLNMFLTHSDSIYVVVCFAYLFLIAYCLRSPNRYWGLLINGILFSIAGFAAKVIILFRPEIRLDDISPILFAHNVHVIIGWGSFVLLLIHMVLNLKLNSEQFDKLFKKLFVIYLVLAIIAVATIVIVGIMKFDMYFLNRRGFLWYVAVYQFLDNDLIYQIFGMGPGLVDTISLNFAFEIEEYYGQYYTLENVHNDVLEYLLTTGVLGFISYVGIYVIIIKDFIQKILKDEDFRGVNGYAIAGLIAYIIQSMLNGPHPLTTAMYFALLAIYRGSKLEENNQIQEECSLEN
ncbi:O-antigen ligase family protein [Butyrivibrio sp. VCD2006]|uniref:O-antigen ligase family protein n=1 Tax=Butyrivibrio sp. VCD2006 TaxID=1280664 RepID=UPI00047A58FF|nr:O-antigen ligase family protein [Butyrivibrio sp. VCD2006]